MRDLDRLCSQVRLKCKNGCADVYVLIVKCVHVFRAHDDSGAREYCDCVGDE